MLTETRHGRVCSLCQVLARRNVVSRYGRLQTHRSIRCWVRRTSCKSSRPHILGIFLGLEPYWGVLAQRVRLQSPSMACSTEICADRTMAKQRSGQSIGESVWQPIQKPTKHYGVFIGCPKRVRMKDLPLGERTGAYASTGKLRAVDKSWENAVAIPL